MAYTFLAAGEDTPIAYVSYAVSSYALVILCANLVPIFQKGRRQVCKNPYIRRYMEDISFKLRFSLHCSLRSTCYMQV